KTWPELQALASEAKIKARKAKNYRDEVIYASLEHFYRFAARQGRLKAALRVAKKLGRGAAFARVLAVHARHFERVGHCKPSRQGKRSTGKAESALDDEAFNLGVRSWLRTLKPGTVTPILLRRHVNDVLLPSLNMKKKSFSTRQCRRWLYRLGYCRKKHMKGVYWDGHERKDVKKQRKEYCRLVKELERYMATYDGAEMAETLPNLGPGEKEHIFIVQDESSFHDNDFQNKSFYLRENEAVLKLKTRGRLMHRSAYLCARYGRLKLTEELLKINETLPPGERLEVTEAGITIFPNGKEGVGDDYWNGVQMAAQLRNAIKIARRLFPNAIIHWIFDNSSCHDCRSPDALSARDMNVKPGGKNPVHMHDTIIPVNPFGHANKSQ
ncbi:hypothetical protein C8R43DRAFT_859411, partial [Mycena crocata]